MNDYIKKHVTTLFDHHQLGESVLNLYSTLPEQEQYSAVLEAA